MMVRVPHPERSEGWGLSSPTRQHSRSTVCVAGILLSLACAAFGQTAPQPAPPATEQQQAATPPALKPKLPAKSKTCVEPGKYRIVAESTDSPTTTSATLPATKYVLAVDLDTRVLLLLFNKDKVEDTELLGYEPVVPADFPFAASLPKDQALVMLRRCSCSQHWRLWIALTVGLGDAVRPKLTLSNSLFVFRESDDGKERATLLTETFPEGTEVTVDDINNDYATEIVVQHFPKFLPAAVRAEKGGAANKFSSLLKIWRVDPEGRLQPVPLDNVINEIPNTAASAEMWLADYRHTQEVLYTEQRIPAPKGATVIRRSYDWDEANKRYALRDIVKTQEIAIK